MSNDLKKFLDISVKVLTVATGILGYKISEDLFDRGEFSSKVAFVENNLLYCIKYLRLYIITGDELYKKLYIEHLKIRNGQTSWAIGILKGKKFGITNLLVSNFGESVITDIIEILNNIFWYDTQAINWVNGFYDENNEAKQQYDNMEVKQNIKFSKKGIKDRQKAIDLLYSDEYMQKIETLFYIIKKNNIDQIETFNNLIFTEIILFIILTVVIIGLLIYIKKLTCLFPLLLCFTLSLLFFDNINRIDKKKSVFIYIWSSSELLSENILNYIVSGKNKYKDEFNKILKARNNEDPMDNVIYTSHFKNVMSSIMEILENMKLQEAIDMLTLSDGLVWLETLSINNVMGFKSADIEKEKRTFDDTKNKQIVMFSEKTTPDKEKGIKILYSNEYIQTKKKIFNKYLKSINGLFVEEKKSRKYIYILAILYGVSTLCQIYT